jgi:nicotinate-nucleotide pyrophosphorylase (carboxylating)
MKLASHKAQGSPPQPDLRELIFREHMGRTISAVIKAEAPGVLSGLDQARELARNLHLSFSASLKDGDQFAEGAELAYLAGNPVQVAKAEDMLIGALSKASGIASAARRARQQAGPAVRVVSGAFKKMPLELKSMVRLAIEHGGVEMRMAPHPFVYLDKNYVRILGGVGPALKAVASLEGSVVIQVRGETAAIGQEAVEAARGGAALIMVDTGRLDDLDMVSQALTSAGLRSLVELAFAGNVDLEQLDDLAGRDLDAVDIGYAIVDAPCLPMRFDVVGHK